MRLRTVSSWILIGVAWTAAAHAECRTSARPAATLLFPYFEVELDDPNGRSTLVAIANASAVDPALAHVVLWTDRGIATLTFDLYLPANDVATINLRDVFVSGTLPVTGGAGFTACSNPLELPPLGVSERAVLRAQHTGQPAGAGGLCWSSEAGGGLALGFVTVDAANACSTTVRLPGDDGYFVDGGTGIASNDNQLYGDFFLVDDAENFAQGSEAIHLVADVNRFGDGGLPTFYQVGTGSRADNRAPLGTRHRSRFLRGGAFDGGTDLLLFTPYGGWTAGQPAQCAALFGGECHQLQFQARDEDGNAEQPFVIYDNQYGGPVSSRLHVGTAPLVVGPTFGLLDVENQVLTACQLTPSPPTRLPAHVTTIHSALGRFSVGLNSIVLESPCEE